MPKLILGGIAAAAIFALSVVLGAFFTVAEYERAVVTRFGEIQRVADPGLNFKIPFADGTRSFRIDIQQMVEKKVNTYTVDNQELDAEITLNYRVPATSVARIYRDVPDYEQRLRTMAIDRFKAEAGKIDVTNFASKRGETARRIGSTIKDEAHRLFGLDVIDFQITDVEYTKTFREAMNQATVAKANVERVEQEKRQADAQADKVRAIAKGDADAKLTMAHAEAEGIKLRGEAEAASIKAQADALQANPHLVELRKAEKWSGNLPQQMLGAVMPFMNVEAPKR